MAKGIRAVGPLAHKQDCNFQPTYLQLPTVPTGFSGSLSATYKTSHSRMTYECERCYLRILDRVVPRRLAALVYEFAIPCGVERCFAIPRLQCIRRRRSAI